MNTVISEFSPNLHDIRFDETIIISGNVVESPHVLDKHLMRHNLFSVLNKEAKDLEFFGCGREPAVAKRHGLEIRIDSKRSRRQDSFGSEERCCEHAATPA